MDTLELERLKTKTSNLDSPHYDSLFKCMILDLDRSVFEKSNKKLPLDQFAPGKGRYRRYSRFGIEYKADGDYLFGQLPHQPFTQSAYYNHYVGDEARQYEELEQELIESKEFQRLLKIFVINCNKRVKELGIHQIKVVCSQESDGVPVPEGYHQDGFDQIGMYCVTRENIIGGETSLVVNKGESPFFNRPMNPGEMMIINDRKFYHYAGPVKAGEASPTGTRSMFIITATLE